MKETYAESYAELQKWHWWFRGRTRILESVLRRELRGDHPRQILSVGCGPATGLTWLVPFAGHGGCVRGLDIEHAHARELPEQVGFVVGRLEEVPFDDATFDVVLALDVLEHLDDDRGGLREAARLVKPGGLLLVTVPALPSLWGRQDVVNLHRRRYTRRALRALFENSGLTDHRVSFFNTILFPLVAAVRWTRRIAGLVNEPHSDFDGAKRGALNEALERVFAFERHLVTRAPMPVGVSLVAVWTKVT